MSYSNWLAIAMFVGISGVAPATLADTPTEPDQPLPSMADVTINDNYSAESLNQLANSIQTRLGQRPNGQASITDAIKSPLLDSLVDGLLDDKGNVSLPLGITVYDAMGTTSIGFGSRF